MNTCSREYFGSINAAAHMFLRRRAAAQVPGPEGPLAYAAARRRNERGRKRIVYQATNGSPILPQAARSSAFSQAAHPKNNSTAYSARRCHLRRGWASCAASTDCTACTLRHQSASPTVIRNPLFTVGALFESHPPEPP